MLINRPSISMVDSINDIENMKELKRIILLYQTKLDPNKYDIYICNSSCVKGIGFYIPSNDIFHNVNSYMGEVTNPFLSNGTVNKSAIIQIKNSFYSSRYSSHFSDEPIFAQANNLSSVVRLEKAINKSGNFTLSTPLPEFYNIEHQLRMANDNVKEFDFRYLLYGDSTIPLYTLGQLIDSNTKILKIEIEHSFQDEVLMNINYNTDFDDSPMWMIYEAFCSLYQEMNTYMFKQLYVIFDTDTESFNLVHAIPNYTQTLERADNKKMFIRLSIRVNEIFNEFLERILYAHSFGDNEFPKNMMRIYFYVSSEYCKLKVHHDIYDKIENFNGTKEENRVNLDESLLTILNR